MRSTPFFRLVSPRFRLSPARRPRALARWADSLGRLREARGLFEETAWDSGENLIDRLAVDDDDRILCRVTVLH